MQNMSSIEAAAETAFHGSEQALVHAPFRPAVLLMAISWAMLMFVISVLAPFLPVPSREIAAAGVLATTTRFVVAVVQFGTQFTRLDPRLLVLLACLTLSAAVWLLMQSVMLPAFARPLMEAREARVPPESMVLLVFIFFETTSN